MLKIDPITSLAMSVHDNPGVYALVLGSGISRAAAIPTGWGVTLDLIEKLAAVQAEDTGGDPAVWFKRKFGVDADYSDLLDQLYDQGSRQAKLRTYFEPNEQEREEGKKLPTAAHKAIARLVRDGYIRCIVTTNFDHLTEDAIRAAGIEPVIVSTADGTIGAPPLAHADCLIIKVHGDYLDVRIKNTKAELEKYEPAMDRLLDQIFDSFGLIVSGWSGDWDPALRSAIERSPCRRYATFWATVGEPSSVAQKTIGIRAAKVIKIESADRFFEALAEKVAALEEASRPNPADVELLVAMAKRYLPTPENRIRLFDLLTSEATETRRRLIEIESPFHGGSFDFAKEAGRREAASERILRLLVVCGVHGTIEQLPLFRRCVEIVGSEFFSIKAGSYPGIHPLILFPAGLAIYVTSLAGMAVGREAVVAELIKARGTLAFEHDRILPLLASSNFETHAQPPGKCLFTPASEFIFKQCEKYVRSLYPNETSYEWAFDRFEYIQALLTRGGKLSANTSFLFGRWTWKAGPMSRGLHPDIRDVIQKEIDRDGDNWFYLRAGFFGGSLSSLRAEKAEFDAGVQPHIDRLH